MLKEGEGCRRRTTQLLVSVFGRDMRTTVDPEMPSITKRWVSVSGKGRRVEHMMYHEKITVWKSGNPKKQTLVINNSLSWRKPTRLQKQCFNQVHKPRSQQRKTSFRLAADAFRDAQFPVLGSRNIIFINNLTKIRSFAPIWYTSTEGRVRSPRS